MMQTVTLKNGVDMPLQGFGVFQVPDAALCERAVSEALAVGYRLIDTASVYGNGEAVGAAVRQSGIPRRDLFITTKVWIPAAGRGKTRRALEASLRRLGLDYLDLYLVHMPFGDYYGAWRDMEEAYAEGRVRAIGVCNFLPDRLLDLCRNAAVPPLVNQVEMHPFCQQVTALELMRKHDVRAQAWAPFAEGMRGIFHNETLVAIGRKYGKTAAQVMLRWNIERGVAVIPKSVHKERIEENFRIWDFTLDNADREAIARLDEGRGLILDTLAPSEVERLYAIEDRS